jgi:WD40 repeat protein
VVNALIALPDGRLASASGETIKLWDTTAVSGLCFATSGVKFLDTVSGLDFLTLGAKLWHMGSRLCLATLTGHNDSVRALAVFPSGRLVSGSDNGTIEFWGEHESHYLTKLYEGITALAVLPDGTLAIGFDGGTIKLWDRYKTTNLTGHQKRVTAFAVLPGGVLASASWDKTIKLWDTGSGQSLATLAGHERGVFALTVLRDGRLASGSLDGTIKLWTLPYPLKKPTLPLVGESNTLAHLPAQRIRFYSSPSSQQFKQLVQPLLASHYSFTVAEQKEVVEISLFDQTVSEKEAIHLLETLQTHIKNCFKHWNLTFNITRHTLIVQGQESKRNALLNLLRKIGLGNDSLKSDQDADDLREKKKEHEY